MVIRFRLAMLVIWVLIITCKTISPLEKNEEMKIEITTSKVRYSMNDNLAAKIVNRSPIRVYIRQSCWTTSWLEFYTLDNWQPYVLKSLIQCLDVEEPPKPLDPGNSMERVVDRSSLLEPVTPGRYRFIAQASSKPDATYSQFESPEFEVME